MINLKGKKIITKNANESYKLLRIALAHGYKLPAPIGILKYNREFIFGEDGQNMISQEEFDSLFLNDEGRLEKPVIEILKWMRDKGYNHLNLSCDEKDSSYNAQAILKTTNEPYAKAKGFEYNVPKVKQVTLREIEEKFGQPIKIIS